MEELEAERVTECAHLLTTLHGVQRSAMLLRRAKIVLNLHHSDAKVLEMCRIMESLSYGALVYLTHSANLRRQKVPEICEQAAMRRLSKCAIYEMRQQAGNCGKPLEDQQIGNNVNSIAALA